MGRRKILLARFNTPREGVGIYLLYSLNLLSTGVDGVFFWGEYSKFDLARRFRIFIILGRATRKRPVGLFGTHPPGFSREV